MNPMKFHLLCKILGYVWLLPLSGSLSDEATLPIGIEVYEILGYDFFIFDFLIKNFTKKLNINKILNY